MSKFILIQNVGVAPVEAFTLLGASNKSGTDAIGQFGSGTKLGTLALLRAGLNPVIYCGGLRLQFLTRECVFDGATHHRVYVQLSGKDSLGRTVNRTEDLSLVLNYGRLDWSDPKLAIREYISNALDATNCNTSAVAIKVVEESQLRASSEHTRIYVPYTEDTRDIVDNLGKWFLHFDPNTVWRTDAIFEKAKPSPARIYRRGVLVREVSGVAPSLFDYNINSLPMDEARTSQDWTVQHYASAVVRRTADAKKLARIIQEGSKHWEGQFTLTDTYDSPIYERSKGTDSPEIRKARWDEAFRLAVPEYGVIAGEYEDVSLAKGKGYTPHRVSDAILLAAKCYGVPTVDRILTSDEKAGRVVDKEVNPLLVPHIQTVWSKLQDLSFVRGKDFPKVQSFSQEMTAGSLTLGYYRDGTVYINNRIITEDLGHELFCTILEELAHYITGATDNSRDFQEFAFSLAASLLRVRGS